MPEKDTMQISALEALLSQGGDCVIVTHTRPDGDALGSATALCSYLRECRGLNASIVLPDSAPDNLSFILQGFEAVVASAQSGKAAGLISSCKLLFCLDFNAFPRAEGLQDLLAASHAEKILIDHHLNPDREAFKLCFSSCEVSSACEMLYSVLLALPDIGTDASRLPSRCRYALMAGMTTDTNNFANSVYPGTLRMASALLESGTDRDSIIDMLYKRDRLQKISAFADLLSSHMQILPGGIACIFMSSDMRKAYGLMDGETEGLVNIPLSIDRVKVRVSIPEKEIAAITPSTASTVTLDALPGAIFQGTRIEKGVTADAVTHTYNIRILLDNPEHKLLPGMVAHVSLAQPMNNEKGDITVPVRAIQQTASKELFVWTAADGKAIRRPIQTGDVTGNRIVVCQGLQEGEQVIVEGYQKVSEGTPIIVSPAAR